MQTSQRDGHTFRATQNDRPKKTTDAKARKGGKQAKGGWAVPSEERGDAPLKAGDPNFEPTTPTTGEWVVPQPTAQEFKLIATRIVGEYLACGDHQEVIAGLDEANARGCGLEPELVKRALLVALDRKQRDREMVSRLLAALCECQVLDADSVAAGFSLLLEDDDYLRDLALDTPDALPALSQFLARAVVDDVLYPSYLDSPAFASPSSGSAVVENARKIGSQHHAAARISKIWGPGDGRPVDEVKKSISLLLEEFLLTLPRLDLAEATQCARELERPYFLHEMVKQAIVCTIDKSAEQQQAIISLLKHLVAEQVLAVPQIQQGFERVLERMEDLRLDVPDALATFKQRFVQPAVELGFVSDTLLAMCIPMSELKQRITSMIDEFFDNGDSGIAEASRCLDELAAPHLHGQIIKRLLNKAMGRDDRERKLASLLIFSWRRDDKISASAVHAGFTSTLSSLADIALDVPDAYLHMQSFVGRAQHDGLLPDAWMEEQ